MRVRFRADEDEGFVAGVSYVNALLIDLRETGDNILQIYNTDASIAIQFKIYATAKVRDTIPGDSDDSWYNILNNDDAIITPSLYNHNLEVSIPALGRTRESLSNKFSWMRIQIKSTSGTPVVKLYRRGIAYSGR